MNKRFSNNNDLLIDLFLLSPSNLKLFKSELPTDSLTKLNHLFMKGNLIENEIQNKLSKNLLILENHGIF
jgi:hypothetical protein